MLFIDLQPFGEFDSCMLELEKKEIESFYSVKCRILPAIQLPGMSYYPPRNRYRADSLLDFLETYKPGNINFIVGLTAEDISCTKEPHADYGIFGLGFMPGHSCVISTYRLGKNVSHAKLKERLTKVVLHELGHNFGLDHCSTLNCLMEDAGGTIKSVDREQKAVCSKCSEYLARIDRTD